MKRTLNFSISTGLVAMMLTGCNVLDNALKSLESLESPTPTVTPSPTPTTTPTPTATPAPTPTAAATPTPTVAPTATPRPTATPAPSATPAPTATPNYPSGITLHPAAGTTWGYGEYLPAGYDNQSNWPILIFLHGQGECTSSSTLSNAVYSHGPFKHLTVDFDVPMVVLAPQSPCNWAASAVNNFITFALAKYKVNPKKLYLTGLSLGGGGTNAYLETYPNKLAAALPVSPSLVYPLADGPAVVSGGTAIWSAVAKDDTTVGVYNAEQDAVWAYIAMGMSSSTNAFNTYPGTLSTLSFNPTTKKPVWNAGQVSSVSGVDINPPIIFTYYPSGGHSDVVWDGMYGDINIYNWMLKQELP